MASTARRTRPPSIGKAGIVDAGAQDEDQHGGDDDIDGGTGEGNGDLLQRFFRHALKPGEPADRKQRDVRRSDAITAGHQRMAEFMGNDAGEQRQDEDDTLDRGRHAALLIMSDADPQQQQEKGDVDADFRSENPGDCERPGHKRSPCVAI
jgi:hypothetical protein